MTSPKTSSPTHKRPLLPPKFVQAMLAGHSALGLAFAALIYIVCLTGTIAVFMFELQRWEQPDIAPIPHSVSAEVVANALQAGQRQALADNAAHDLFIMGPNPHSGYARLAVGYRDHETDVRGDWIANADGDLVARAQAPWTTFVTVLHGSLHLPHTWGAFLVGLTGVALLSSLVSGLLSHPRMFKDAFHLRWGGSRRLQDADLHNRLGVWGLPFHFVVSLSGALIGLATLVVGVLALAAYDGDTEKAFAAILGPHAGPDESAGPLPDIAAMIRAVQAAKPDAVFTSANFDHIAKADQVVHLGMRAPGHLPLANVYYFKGDGMALGDGGLEEGGIGQQILGVLQPLHFGWFGGIPVKLAYGVLGIALSIVTYTGVTIWLSRRRDKGRPAPGWEKIWAGVGWGQPLALGLSALAALYLGSPIIIPAYLAASALAILFALGCRSGTAAAAILRTASAFVLLAVVFAHLTIWNGRVVDTMGVAVDTTLLLVALGLLMPLAKRRSGVNTMAPSLTK
ncbi:PepSY-associated TM helix domain-containing protein [Hyphomicrobium sp. D-2]|uniref:PepSY-associated TM helix domain-containing protein n=1 Tax=Hyphomicrobium sp. D-2 TaxID=3041621 RepID=UPI0024578090|nr:PepSY-associated TM helix domain-containing protein [Hyphomicrobium sp. D-2]MDH4981230.1 PepSY-associated TM helix domain-containing protein [Hyphomicrobium sp. D-2]